MTTHLKPTELRAFQVTEQSINSGEPDWTGLIGEMFTPGTWYCPRLDCYGSWNDYLVAPWPDQPDHIEVWPPEQYAARTGGCPYEECAELLEGDSICHLAKDSFDVLHKGMMQEPEYDASAKGGLHWSQPFSFAEVADAIRQLSKQKGGAHE